MLRRGATKLICHVGMPPQLFDLASDPGETRDLGDTEVGRVQVAALEAELRTICDPEAVDRRARDDRRRRAEECGGTAAIRRRGAFVYTPPSGVEAEMRPSA